jgi:hypothetical protein
MLIRLMKHRGWRLLTIPLLVGGGVAPVFAQSIFVGPPGDYTARFSGSTASGQSFGPIISAGTNASDLTLDVRDVTQTKNHLLIRGDGTVLMNGGKVGIGTGTPADRLHVVGPPGDYTARFSGSTASGQSFGPIISAGTNASDLTLDVRDVTETKNYFLIRGDGTVTMNGDNVGIGTFVPTAKLHVAGNVQVDGNIAAKYQDVAEWVKSERDLPAATVVIIDPQESNRVTISDKAYDTRVAGVVSATPGLLLGEGGEDKAKVAHSGRVKVKVDAKYGAIATGDLLVTSSTPGHAMRSEPIDVGATKFHRPGTLIGKALEPLEEGRAEILVLMTLQ